jgi:hypothetical protein
LIFNGGVASVGALGDLVVVVKGIATNLSRSNVTILLYLP